MSKQTKMPPACFNCETGHLLAGGYGRYCPICDTYLPTGKADDLAGRYFEAMDTGDEPRAGELFTQLEFMRLETIRTAQ